MIAFRQDSFSLQRVDADDSLAGRIAHALSERIVSGQLLPGARLMQDHIAEEFQASHVPVREAFRKLEAQGLVVSKPRCGVRVSELDPAMVREVTEIRAALEGLALSHALPRIGEADIEAARQALAEGEASNQIAVWEAANRRFHLAITAPCAMPRLMASISDLHRSDARFLFATWKQLDWQPRSDTEHRAILDAVTRRDGEGARALLEAHVREAGRALVERLHSMVRIEADAA
jgi:DNA-binding GntR family transcriptional regulator